VYVIRISDDPRRFAPGARLLDEDGRELVVASARDHRNRLLVRFEGVDDRDSAGELRGPLYVGSSDARELPAGEFWEHELAGLEVVLAGSGERVGTVSYVQAGPAQDLLVLDTPAGERMIPLVADIVTAVDLPAGRVTVAPPEGLL
jgi:16S rRNA processing protein RimM